jgi:hypothetical protein
MSRRAHAINAQLEEVVTIFKYFGGAISSLAKFKPHS